MTKLNVEDLKEMFGTLLELTDKSQIRIKDILLYCKDVKVEKDLTDVFDEITDTIKDLAQKCEDARDN